MLSRIFPSLRFKNKHPEVLALFTNAESYRNCLGQNKGQRKSVFGDSQTEVIPSGVAEQILVYLENIIEHVKNNVVAAGNTSGTAYCFSCCHINLRKYARWAIIFFFIFYECLFHVGIHIIIYIDEITFLFVHV